MGGYKERIKAKFHKWKAKFSSGPKAAPQSPPIIAPNSVTRELFTKDKFADNPKEQQGQNENLTQEGKIGNSWKKATYTTKQGMAEEMAADANSTQADKLEIKKKEMEDFMEAHPSDDMGAEHKGVEHYKTYTSNFHYSIMNSLARTGKPPETAMDNRGIVRPVTEEDVEVAIAAMKGMSKDMGESRLKRDLVTYRGVGNGFTKVIRNQLGIGNNVTEEEMNRRLKGAVLFDKAFTSTSLSPYVAEKFARMNSHNEEATIFQIHAPKGLKATYLEPISAFGGEDELLVDQNTPLRVLEVKMVEDSQGVNYRLVRAEFLNSYSGEHRAKVSNDYDLKEWRGRHLKNKVQNTDESG